MSETPMMQQWKRCKEQAKDALVLFRLGDFYEAFYEDAVIIAKEIELTLTKRQEIPMCGVPVHTCEHYLDKLIAKGHKVAIAEQMDDPKVTKGIVRREIVRFVSPGTVINSQLLSDNANNFFLSLAQVGQTFGLGIIDLTTSEFQVMEIEDPAELMNEIVRLKPAELLISKNFSEEHKTLLNDLKWECTFILNVKETALFEGLRATDTLTNHFTLSIEELGLKGKVAAISAAGGLLRYLKEELCIDLSHIKKLHNEKLGGFLAIDRTSLRNLDILPREGSFSLLKLLDKTATPMGARRLANWVKHPLLSLSEIDQRAAAVEELTKNPSFLSEIVKHLNEIRDLERLIMRIQSGFASPKDLKALSLSLQAIPKVFASLQNFHAPFFKSEQKDLENPDVVIRLIEEALLENPPMKLHDGDTFREGYHKELDELKELSRSGKNWIARYQNHLRETLGIKTLKVGYTRVFGYYIDVSKGQSNKVPDTFQRRQTLVNSERFISEELKTFEHKVLTAEEKIKGIENLLFGELRKKVSEHHALIQKIAKAISHIDVIVSFAHVALAYGYVRPVMTEEDVLTIEEGRHPIIEKAFGFSDFIPNDTKLDEEERLYLITGPNMAGKSTYIRQVALLVIMAQIGSFVPAKSATIGLVDKVFSRVGASDDIARGQSTFMVEMQETANILTHATNRSLVILDEIGRGTSTYDGISIAWAVAEFLLTAKKKRAKTLFATHYWELTKMEQEIPGAVNYQVAVNEVDGGIVFLRKIIKGGTDKSYGIHVARLAGLPASCIRKAENMLFLLEKENRKKPQEKSFEDQLSLFTPDPQKEEIIEEIENVDINQMTPLEAQNILYNLQKKVKKPLNERHEV